MKMDTVAPRIINSQRKRKRINKFLKENKPSTIDGMIVNNIRYYSVNIDDKTGFAQLKRKKVSAMLASKNYLEKCFNDYMDNTDNPEGSSFQAFAKNWIKQFDSFTVDLAFTQKKPSQDTCEDLAPVWEQKKKQKSQE